MLPDFARICWEAKLMKLGLYMKIFENKLRLWQNMFKRIPRGMEGKGHPKTRLL